MTNPKAQDELRFKKVWNAQKGELLFVNVWATGFQELIFRSATSAAKWAANRGAKYIGPPAKAQAA